MLRCGIACRLYQLEGVLEVAEGMKEEGSKQGFSLHVDSNQEVNFSNLFKDIQDPSMVITFGTPYVWENEGGV